MRSVSTLHSRNAPTTTSPKTARNHIEHIYVKTGATRRVDVSLFAIRHGLLEAPLSRLALHPRRGKMGHLPHDAGHTAVV